MEAWQILANSPAWLTPQLRDGQLLSRLALYLPPGTFSDPAEGEVFNQKGILIPIADSSDDILVAFLSLALPGDDNGMVFRCQDGAAKPLIQHGVWRLPVGSLFITKRLAEGLVCSAKQTLSSPPRGWKRRFFVYRNPETPFNPSAILYKDSRGLPCFVEEFNPGGETVAVTRFDLFW